MPTVTSAVKGPGQRCICQICTCGRHRCPHRPGTTSLRPAGTMGPMGTEYKERFLGDNMGARQPQRRHPDSLALAQDPMQALTSNRSDYVAHGVVPRQRAMNDGGLLRPEGDMDLNTSYNAQYDGKPIERSRAPRPADALGNSGNFEGRPTYKDDYRQWEVQRPAKTFETAPLIQSEVPFVALSSHQADFAEKDVSQKTRSLRPKTSTKVGGDFLSNTTSREAFQGLQGERRANMKPEASPTEPSQPFEGQTTAHDYQPWASKRPQRREPGTTLGPSGDQSDMTTTNLAEYVSKSNAERTIPLRPRTATKLSESAFDGATTQRSDYGPQSTTAARHAQRPPTHIGVGDGNFLGQTTNRSDYGGPGAGRRASNLRPSTMQKMASGAFQDDTTNRREFQGRQGSPVGKIIHRQEYRPPTGPFEGATTNKSDFVPIAGEGRARAIRRVGPNLFDNNGLPVDGVSSYRADYAKRDAAPCPAEGLSGDGSGNAQFRYRNQVGGHHFYASAPIIV